MVIQYGGSVLLLSGVNMLNYPLIYSRTTLALVATLIDIGASVNGVVSRQGKTPLHIAATRRDRISHAEVDIVCLLLDKGADPTACDDNGNTPAQEVCIDSTLRRLLRLAAEEQEQLGGQSAHPAVNWSKRYKRMDEPVKKPMDRRHFGGDGRSASWPDQIVGDHDRGWYVLRPSDPLYWD